MRQRWSDALVVLEITFILALLVVTSSMISSYQRARIANLGSSPDPLMTVRVDSKAGIPVAQLADLIRNVPGVTAVSAATAIPLGGAVDSSASAPIQPAATHFGPNSSRSARTSSPRWDVRMQAGRSFTSQDTPTARIAIVNESLAVQLFGGASPIGRQV